MKLFPWKIVRQSPDESAKKHAPAEQKPAGNVDPLDLMGRTERSAPWPKDKATQHIPVTIDAYPVHMPKVPACDELSKGAMDAMDAKVLASTKVGMDANDIKNIPGGMGQSAYTVPEQLQNWYNSMGFIGYQSCAIIAQHWLVDKACSQAGEDAIRNGWEIKTDGDKLSDETLSEIKQHDVDFKLKENLAEFNRFKNIFGIRVAIFEVESDDPDYYEKIFNIDGVTKGSYKGISQVDPYWMTPMMTSDATANPASRHFYDPEYWIISGKKYHRSHLMIARGPVPADILKPTYIFGGVPLTQRIYERVYAAERTANEAPLLALNKRTTTIYVDTAKAILNEESFLSKIMLWVKYRDNHAVKVLGTNEKMEQIDTSLADFDSIIMNQYQLVAAIAKTPSTKLLGTSPKGFDATGEFESKSYHEELESIQEHVCDPMLDRHYLLTLKSFGLDVRVNIVWNSVDSISTKERAELNLQKAQSDEINANLGAVSPEEVRQRLRDDPHSGYNRLSDDEANEVPGMTPENIAELEKAASEKLSAAPAQAAQPAPTTAPAPAPATSNVQEPAATGAVEAAEVPQVATLPSRADNIKKLADDLAKIMSRIQSAVTINGADLPANASPGVKRSTQPSTSGAKPSVAGAGSVVEAKDEHELPSMKIHHMDIAIENPRDSIRTAKDGSWSIKMPHHYGYLKNTVGADGDGIDVFVGRSLNSPKVFVVNQVNKEGGFDEHKVLLGFHNSVEAAKGYNDSFKHGWDGLGSMVEMDVPAFKDWLANGNKANPLSEVNIQTQTEGDPGMSS